MGGLPSVGGLPVGPRRQSRARLWMRPGGAQRPKLTGGNWPAGVGLEKRPAVGPYHIPMKASLIRTLCLVAVVAAAATCSSSALGAVAVGQPAPDFSLTDITGQVRKLSDYRGKTVVLE